MPKLWFVIFFHLLLYPPITYADLQAKVIPLDITFQAKVIHVADGDTITVLTDANEKKKIRLNGVDCPESGQAYGNKAKEFTKSLVAGQVVKVQAYDLDRYGRTIGDVMLGDGRNLSHELVKAGYAWWFFKYSNDEQLGILEVKAKVAKVGLWADKNPVPPWIFRPLNKILPEHRATIPSNQSHSKEDPPMDGGGEIRGNKNSKKYHRPDCPNYDDISPKNRVPFDSAQEAEEAGYELAGNCPSIRSSLHGLSAVIPTSYVFPGFMAPFQRCGWCLSIDCVNCVIDSETLLNIRLAMSPSHT